MTRIPTLVIAAHGILRVEITEPRRYQKDDGSDFEAAQLRIETTDGLIEIGLFADELGTLKSYDTEEI